MKENKTGFTFYHMLSAKVSEVCWTDTIRKYKYCVYMNVPHEMF